MLSPIIFTMVIDWIMKTSMDPPKGIQWTLASKLEDIGFADNVRLLSHQLQQMQQKTEYLYQTANSTGLEINIDKTKNLRINAQQNDPVILNSDDIEDVSHFSYLESIINATGRADEDIRVRKGKARQAFIILRPVWRNRILRTKLRIFETNVKSILMYGSKTWKQTKKNEQDV
jgi:hypothetical protein